MAIIFAVIPTDSCNIENAAVNSENGDIALYYYGPLDEGRPMRVKVFDKTGKMLYSKVFSPDKGGATMLFDGEEYTLGQSRAEACLLPL